MLGQDSEFLWSDKWAIENSKAWMVAGEFNILFCLDMAMDNYKIVAELPIRGNAFRQNSNCIKYEDVIFCIPNKGNCIWYYDLSLNEFKKIEITNINYIKAGIGDFWRCGNILWAVSAGLGQVLEIDLRRKQVVGYYNISDQKDSVIAQSAKEDNSIFIVCSSKAIVYEFDIETKEIKPHMLLGVKDCLRTIVVHGRKAWLSGNRKALYMWERETDEITILNDFPNGFGIYNFDGVGKALIDTEMKKYNSFAFLESVFAGDYFWFIPFQTSQILYVNKDTCEIKALLIEEEEENIESIKNREMNCKYILQYVYKNRYIGLYSLKNKIVFEIDAVTMRIKTHCISMDTSETESIIVRWILSETISTQRAIFKKLIEKSFCTRNTEKTVGREIFNSVK